MPESVARTVKGVPPFSGVVVEGVIGGERTVVEQLDGRTGRVEWSDGDELLAGEAEPLPRGGEHPDAGAALDEHVGQLGGAVDDVFAVVEHESRLTATRQHPSHLCCITNPRRQPDRTSDREPNIISVDRNQITPPHLRLGPRCFPTACPRAC